MATNFPTSLQDLDSTRGTTVQPLSSPDHVTHHQTEDDTIEALQAKVGVDNSAVTTSLDYIVKNPSSDGGGHVQTAAKGGTGQTTYTKGDLLVARNSTTLDKLAVGSDNQVLTADSSQTDGVKWADSSSSASFVFGETIADREAVVIAAGGSGGTQTVSQTTDDTDDDTDADLWRGQSFVTPSNTFRIDSIRIRGKKTGSPTGNLTMYIRTAIGSGTLYTSNVAYSSIGTSDADITFTFTDAFVVAGVTYYFVIDPGDVGGGTKYLNVRYSGGGGYAGGARYTAINDSGWAASDGGSDDLDFTVTLTDTTAGRVYRSSAQVAARSDTFIGFATQAGTIGQTKSVQVSNIVTGLTSITTGSTYYLANTPGTIATSAGTVSRKIGMGASTTSLLIKNDNI